MRKNLISFAVLASLGLAFSVTAAQKKAVKPTPAPTKTAAAAPLPPRLRLPLSLQSPAAAPAAGTVEATASPELVGQLTKQLGVTPKQAEGGAGAILGYAKGKMKVEDYAKVASAVPGCDNLVKAAPVVDAVAGATGSTGGGGALGGAVSALGSQAGGAAGLVTAVTPAFQKLGLSGETVGKFAPIVLQYVTGKGGSGVGNLLGGVLK